MTKKKSEKPIEPTLTSAASTTEKKFEVKQAIRGCPTQSDFMADPFNGYDHSISEEEQNIFDERSKAFWKSKGITYP